MTRTSALGWIVLASAIGVLDAFFKKIAITRFPAEGSRVLSPIDFALHKNPGIAFDIPVPLTIVFICTVVISIWMAIILTRSWKTAHFEQATSCALILIGALGNFTDRWVHGFTTDYIILFRTSAINLSDVLILLGMIGFLWYSSRNPQTRS